MKSLRKVQYCSCKTRKRRGKGKDTEKDTWDRCVYHCKICDKDYYDRRLIRHHIINFHKMDYKTYLQDCGDPEVACPKWQCPICNSSVKFTITSIETHLTQQHKRCLSEFESEFGRPKEVNTTMENPTTPSQSYNPATSAQQIQALQQVQPSENTHHIPTAAHRSVQPAPRAIPSQPLLEKHPTPLSMQAWLPVPPLRNVIGLINVGAVARRSSPLPCDIDQQSSSSSFPFPPASWEPGQDYGVSQTIISVSPPMDMSDIEENFPSSSEMI